MLRKEFEELKYIHRIGFRCLKIIHSMDSSILPIHILEIVLVVIKTYTGLYITAELIDRIIEQQWEKAVFMAGILLLSGLGIDLIWLGVRKSFRRMKTKIWLEFYRILRQKTFTLGYETMEEPEMAEKIAKAEQDSDYYGGLGLVLYNYCEVLRGVLNIAASVCLVISLCLRQPVSGGSMLMFLMHPIPSIILFPGLLAGMLIVSHLLSGEFRDGYRNLTENHTKTENKVKYLLEQVCMNYKAGKIVRLYEMQDMLHRNSAREDAKIGSFYYGMFDMMRKEGDMRNLIYGVFVFFSYFLVVLKVMSGAVTVGAFTRYAGTMNQFGNACFQIITANTNLRRISMHQKDFFELLDMEDERMTGTIPVEKRLDGEYEIAFENVSFCYPGSEEKVLKNVNCRLNMKDKMAVVGRNGAGKTTFIKLLCRLYEPTEGRITLNGVDIRKYKEEEYRDLFSVVFQDFKLFAFSVRENIAAGYDAKEEQIWEALRQAGAGERVQQMPEQLNTVLYKDRGDGIEISGGEAQKLALARALYKDAALVILDEPTAALDPIAEAEIYEGFDRMVEGKTSIYISHRMSSCRFCNDIIVFCDGEITERGSHEQLLDQNGEYAQLWRAQAQYYA